MGPFHVFLLLNVISFLLGNPQTSKCDLCTRTTRAGNVVTGTLLFHTYYSCAGTAVRSYTHNHTTYSVRSHGSQHICFNPTYCPWEQWLEVQRFDSATWRVIRDLINHIQVFNTDNPVSVFFDVCTAIGQDSGGCGGLAWERASMSNDKRMCQGGWPCDDAGWHYLLTGVVFHGLPGRWQNTQPPFAKGQLPQTVPSAPVTP
jgi:hypothetical protein